MRKRFSLRRKTLLIVLALAFVPSLVTLVVAYTTGVTALRAYIIDQSRARLSEHAQRIGDRILPASTGLRQLVENPTFTAGVEGLVSGTTPPADVHAADPDLLAMLQVTPTYVLHGDKTIRIGPISPTAESAAGIEEAHKALFGAIQRNVTEPICGVEIAIESPREIQFWLLGRVDLRGVPADRAPWVARQVEIRDLEGSFGGDLSIGQERVHILSTRHGAISSSSISNSLDLLLQERRAEFNNPDGVIRAGEGEYWVYLRTGAIEGLTRPTGRETSWVLLQRINTQTATAAISYGIWRIALFGVIFVAFVGAFGIWLSMKMVNPIRQLRAGFRRFELGDLEHRLDLRTGDELEELADSANRMAEILQKSYQTLADKLLQLDDKAQQLAITYEVAKSVNRSLDLELIFRNITEQICNVVPCERICFGLVSEDRKLVEIVWSWPSELQAEARQIVIEDSLVKGTIATGEPTIYLIEPDGPRQLEQLLKPEEPKHICIVPLVTTTGPVGVLLLEDRLASSFRTQDIDILRRISENIAIAIEHSHLYHQQARFADQLEHLVRDRTSELERAQQQLLKTEKLAAAGEIAANVAHEINNPLSIIKNYIKLLQTQFMNPKPTTQDSEMSREGLIIIGEEIERIARIVDQLRKINAPQQPVISPLDVNLELRQMVELFRHTFHQKHVDLVAELDDRIGIVMLCGDYLRQIVINLLRNANDACGEGGQITLRTSIIGKSTPQIAIAVSDNGAGIRRDHLEKIFDPFFTTKTEGRGTGLGLSVSYGLARNLGGTIEAKSELGVGTTMTLLLPLNRADESDRDETSAERDPIQRKGHQIIIG